VGTSTKSSLSHTYTRDTHDDCVTATPVSTQRLDVFGKCAFRCLFSRILGSNADNNASMFYSSHSHSKRSKSILTLPSVSAALVGFIYCFDAVHVEQLWSDIVSPSGVLRLGCMLDRIVW
jgi:hypothetical protein